MAATLPVGMLEKFSTFGDFLRFLRRRTGITQTELSIAVGYSVSQISRLEQNLRLPDIPTLEARFVEALDLQEDPKAIARLLELAATVRREDAPAAGLCPYKGLNYFDEADAELFVGREGLTTRLAQRVLALAGTDSRFLAIVGASGSGKSSLVRAGLVPALRWDKASTGWHIRILTPTAHPLESLAASLTGESDSVVATATLMDDLAADSRSLSLFSSRRSPNHHSYHLLLVIDQFEELFALCRSEEERSAFIGNLLTAASKPDGSTVVVITLRADFYAHCASYPDLREALAAHQEYIGAMTADELQRAIEEPARRGHWELEDGLVEQLLHDVRREPGALPLLSHALLETWERRRGTLLTLSGYAASGGVRGAIAETAEAVFADQFDERQQAIARRIFLRLTELGDETATGDTRRRATYDELILKPEEAESTQTVLKALADARLIITSENSAEVAHEALIREWPTLRGWLEDNREGLRVHRNLTEAAQEWQALERPPDMLYRGTRLAQAQDWAAGHADDLNTLEREFLDASTRQRERDAQERDAQRKRELEAALKLADMERSASTRLRLRNRVITGVGAVALLLAILAATFGLNSSANARQAQTNLSVANQQKTAAQSAQATAQAIGQSADKAALNAFSRELAAQAQVNLTVDPERSILLALAALGKADTLEAENALHAAVFGSRLRMTLRGHQAPIPYVAYSPDGKLIATGSDDKTARLWDAATGKQLATLQHPADVKVVLFTPDGSRLITLAGDGVARVWSVTSGSQLLSFTVTHPMALDYFFSSAALSHDGKILATTNADDGVVKLWDLSSGVQLATLSNPDWLAVAPGVDLAPVGLAFSPDGRLAISLATFEQASGRGRIEIWDPQARKRLLILTEKGDPYGSPDFRPDGMRLVSRIEGYAAVWDTTTGKLLFTFHLKQYGVGGTVRYNADGSRLLIAAGGGFIYVMDAANGSELILLVGTAGRVRLVDGSPDCVKPPAAAFTSCTTHLASVGDDGLIRIWDISHAGQSEALSVPADDMALSPDGKQMYTLTYDPNPPQGGSTVTIEKRNLGRGLALDPASGYSMTSFRPGQRSLNWLFFADRGGIHLMTPFDNGPMEFWDIQQGGKQVFPISCCNWTNNMEPALSSLLHPRMAIGFADTGSVLIWDLASDQQLQKLQVFPPGSPPSLQLYNTLLSPDGQRLVTLLSDTTLQVWDTATGKALVKLPGPVGTDNSEMDFSPDGKLLLIADCSGTQVVRDVATGAEVRRFSQRSCTNGAAFSPDNKLLVLRGPISKVYSVETGQEVLTLPYIGGGYSFFTPDGSRLVLMPEPDSTGFSTAQVFLLHIADLIALAKTRITRGFTIAECQQYLHLDACPADSSLGLAPP